MMACNDPFKCLLTLMLFLYACLLAHFAVRQTEPRLAIRLSHPVIFHYTGERTLFMTCSYVYSFVTSFRPKNDSSLNQ